MATRVSTFTDIGYFSAKINEQGALTTNIKRPDLTGEFDKPVRIHLIISAPWNKTILNFCLRKDLPLRKKILQNINLTENIVKICKNSHRVFRNTLK